MTELTEVREFQKAGHQHRTGQCPPFRKPFVQEIEILPRAIYEYQCLTITSEDTTHGDMQTKHHVAYYTIHPLRAATSWYFREGAKMIVSCYT